MSSKCLKTMFLIQGQFFPPIFRKTETYELMKENLLGSTAVAWLEAYIHLKKKIKIKITL